MRAADHMANGSTSKFLYYFEKILRILYVIIQICLERIFGNNYNIK